MELKFDYLLYLHIAAGFTALASGFAAAFFTKGSKRHKSTGQIFVFSMSLSAVVAILLALWHPNPFLLGIGFFTLYLVSSGWIWIRRIPFAKKIKMAKSIGAAGILTAGYMTYIGISRPGGAIILFVLGGILAILSITDLVLKTTPDKAAGRHGGRMGGALIAAFTAFLATNVHIGPALLIWLGPTAVGTPLIILGIRKFYARSGKKT